MSFVADLDHVALAVEQRSSLWPRYARDLGGVWAGGGPGRGYLFGQLRYENGMKLEILEPLAGAENDFLRRFLDHSGPGVHHVTFKVDDFDVALDACAAAAFEPVNVSRDNPDWMEAFLHPKSASGIVVQLARGGEGDHPDDEPAPADLPSPARSATFDRLVHLVADLGAARSLFEGLLGGRPVDDGTIAAGTYVDLAWPGPGRIRLVQPSPDTAEQLWLGSRPGRAHHLAFSAADPADVPGTRRREDGAYEIDPTENFGVRVVVR